jgi:hypothetical protein
LVIILSLIITYPILGSLLLNSDITKTNLAYAAPTPLPIIRIEERFSPTDTTGEATSGRLQIISGPMTADGGCEICQFIKYTPGPGQGAQAGVAYKVPNGIDISGARRAVFFAKGELGGENVLFVTLGKPSSPSSPSRGPFANLGFNAVTQKIVLTNDWKRYEISLDGTSVTGVTDLFGFVLFKGRTNTNPVVPISLRPALNDNNVNNVDFFIKGVAIDGNPPATTPIPLNSTATTSLATAPTSSLAFGNTTTPLTSAQIASSPVPTTTTPTSSNTTTGGSATTPVPTTTTPTSTTPVPTTTTPTSTTPVPTTTTPTSSNTTTGGSATTPVPTTTTPTSSNTTTATTSITAPSTLQEHRSIANPLPSSNSNFGSRPLMPPTLNEQQGLRNSGILQNGQQPPIANAGLPQTVAENSIVTLDGKTSYDPDGGNIIAYQWTQIPNNGAVPVTLLGSNTATPIFRAPVVQTDTILMFSLRVVDSDGGTISTNPAIAYVLVRHGFNTAIPNTAIPNTAIPNTAIPNTAIPNTAIPNTAIPNTAIPNIHISPFQ